MKRADVAALAAAFLIVLGTLAGGALAQDRPAHMTRMAAADGVLSLSNSSADGAVISAQGLLPGDTATGTITIGNTGEVDGTLGLARTWIDDEPGPNGGRLTDVLTLLIEDVTGTQPREVFYGELGGMERVALERLPAGVQRTYRFTVGFPDSGPHGADNAYIGSAVRFDYEWRADPLPTATPTPTATPAPTATPGKAVPTPTPAPGSGPSTGQGGEPTPGGPTAAPRITLRVPHQRVLHTDAVKLFARCDVDCKVRFGGRAKTAPRGRRKAKAAVLMRKRLFRGERRKRRVPVTGERMLKLKLTPRGRRVLRRELDSHGRVAVVIRARVKGSAGVRRVRKRIVLHTTLIRHGVRIDYR